MKRFLVFCYKGLEKEKRVLIVSEIKEDTSILGTKRLIAEKTKEFFKEKLDWSFDEFTKKQDIEFIKSMTCRITEDYESSIQRTEENLGIKAIHIDAKPKKVSQNKIFNIKIRTNDTVFNDDGSIISKIEPMEEYKTKVKEFKDFKLFIKKEKDTGYYYITEAYSGCVLVSNRYKKRLEEDLELLIEKAEKIKELIFKGKNFNPQIVDNEYLKKLVGQEKKEYKTIELIEDCCDIKSYFFAKMRFEVISEDSEFFNIMVENKTYEIPKEKAIVIKDGEYNITLYEKKKADNTGEKIRNSNKEKKAIKIYDKKELEVYNVDMTKLKQSNKILDESSQNTNIMRYYKAIEKLDKKISKLKEKIEETTNEVKFDHYNTICKMWLDTKYFIQEFFEKNPKEIKYVLEYSVIKKQVDFGKTYYLIEHNIYGEEDCCIVSDGKILERNWYDSLEQYLKKKDLN